MAMPVDRKLLCPSSAEPMKYARMIVPRPGERDDIRVYGCSACGVMIATDDHQALAAPRIH